MQTTTSKAMAMENAARMRAQKAASALKGQRFQAALKIAKTGLKADPKQAYLAIVAGLASVQIGDVPAAIRYFLAAWRSEPEMVEAPRNLAQALIMLGQTDKALEVLGKAVKTWPLDEGLLYLVASAHHKAGNATDTILATISGLQITPESAALHTLRALAYEQIGDSINAETDFLRAVKLAPQDAETRRSYAQFLAFHGQSDVALSHVNKGLEASPGHEGLLLQKASLHQAKDDPNAAIACYEILLADHPEHALALNSLAYLVAPTLAAKTQMNIIKVMRKASTSRETKMLLGFAQAHLAEVTKQRDAAQLLAQANAFAAKLMPYDVTADQKTQTKLIAPFIAKAIQQNTSKRPPAPIFVTGLIRSGTTLLEQVLARHPLVEALGELPCARHLADACATGFAQDGGVLNTIEFAEAYRASVPHLAKDTTHFVDKMPDNFRVIGYLINAFPNATILEMQRDPRDVALSMWGNHFPTMAHSYANAMPAMAAHMNLYAETMQQWREMFAHRIHAVSYEDLTTNFEPTTRHIAALCGLEWHSDMRHPERSSAAVLTASVNQVREPVHVRSVGKWQTQETLLAPFLSALNPVLWPALSLD